MRLPLRRWLTGGLPGQAVVWAAVMMPMFLAVVGLAIDGGVAMKAQRQLQSVADGAARAGAMQIDQKAYRASSGGALQLDPAKAKQAAAQYVSAQAPDVSGDVTADPQQVVVSLKQQIPTTFIQIVGIDHMEVDAVAPARIRFGIQQEVGGPP
ncbi:MAG TPA: Tad domain-containing protein [Chloroflexota bacterium]|nr:Tad domain-containing protein [Chloroflexota bacterium]